MFKTAKEIKEKIYGKRIVFVRPARRWLEESHGFITALTPHLGYDLAAEMVKKAMIEKKQLREIILESGLFTAEDLEEIFTPGQLTRPGVAGAKYIKIRGR